MTLLKFYPIHFPMIINLFIYVLYLNPVVAYEQKSYKKAIKLIIVLFRRSDSGAIVVPISFTPP